jgi:pantetheine-phosphate adenylyltransferase
MRRAVCPGSFDPVTHGHLDIVARASRVFDEVVVAVLVNEAKQGLFTVDERLELLRDAVGELGLGNVRVASFQGLLVDFCNREEAVAIVKGLRAAGDLEFELQMAQMNQRLTGIDTVFVPTSPEWSFVASSLVKEVARFGGDVSGLVPSGVLARLRERFPG